MSLRRLLLMLLLFLLSCGQDRSSLPSIVLVTLDTVRCDHLGLYGDARGLSPHLDALGERGLVFERAFTTMPTTGPAHLSLFTGLYPSEHGSLANGEPLDPELGGRSLTLRLQQQGYATAAFVTTQLLEPRVTGLQGFEIYDSPRGPLRPGKNAVEAALAWLEVEQRRPLFLWVHLYDAHAPYGSADQKRRSYPLDLTRIGFVRPDLFGNPAERSRVAGRYATGVFSADAALGALLEGLNGHFEQPPLVVVTGDHGEALDEHLETRGYAYDHGEFLDGDVVCVPLVLVGPDVLPGRTKAPVSVRDLYGTLQSAAGVGPDETSPDLRRPPEAGRIVAVERRRLGPGSDSRARAHAAAAFDAETGVIVGEDGRPGVGTDPSASELLGEARRHLRKGSAPGGRRVLDREALEALGYVE
jgi:arylsulfatase A-like enzyme